ncbi:unnamed protein product [Caenorhabditis angaria]|uniref:Lipid-binding serum glycoprotein C-terminal domain-containing protein n=1 Tax=Caenorhabditis angaria TaxID=860376 RepID=A0A9P1MZ34_9PELO|nr:unnamed protein product [Caenorhabditis angaria]
MKVLFFLCSFFLHLILANNETLKVRLNYSVFKFFSKDGHHVVDEEIPNITIPNITVPFSTSVGDGIVSTDVLKIEKFKTPDIEFELSEEGISWQSKYGAVKLNGLWAAQFTELVTVRDSGWLTAIASDIRMNISASVFELDGQPQIRIGNCSVEIVHLHVEIGGSVLSWLVNLFRSPLSSLLKDVIHSQACAATRGILIDQANQFLHDLPTHIDIGKNFYVDYSLLKNPISTRKYAEFDLSADIIYGETSKCHAINQKNWTKPAGKNTGMVTTWVSVSIPNCLIESAHNNSLVKIIISKDLPIVQSYLQTTCGIFSICIGKFFEKLRTSYPNQYIDLFFHTYSTPFFTFSKLNGVMLNMSLAVDLYINPMQKTSKNILARLIVETISDVEPYLEKSRIFGNIRNFTIETREDFSNIGDVSTRFLSTFSSILSMTAKQAVRSILALGIPIPSFDNVTLADTSRIDIFDDFVLLNVDLKYN